MPKQIENPKLRLVEDDIEVNENQAFEKMLNKKLKEVSDLFDSYLNVLKEINLKREELNKQEETVQIELSGLNGAKVVINQLLLDLK
jgi:hypothetical protein